MDIYFPGFMHFYYYFYYRTLFTFIFNLILPYIIAQRNEYKFSYDRYNLLESEANEISLKIKHIDISLAANRFFLSSDLTDSMKQKRKHLENLIRIYDKMRIIYVNNEELLTNYYLVKSEYSKIPSYDVDLEKVKKLFQNILCKVLKSKIFLILSMNLFLKMIIIQPIILLILLMLQQKTIILLCF